MVHEGKSSLIDNHELGSKLIDLSAYGRRKRGRLIVIGAPLLRTDDSDMSQRSMLRIPTT